MAEAPVTPPGTPENVPGGGATFFERGRVVAETGNYDYAIDMFIEGLTREPDNVEEHERLRNVSLTRKVKGGKAARGLLGPKPPFKGKTPTEQMLNATWILAKDPGNIPQMMTLLRAAVAANLPKVVAFYGPIATHANRTSKTPRKDLYVELAKIYEKVQDYHRAAEAVLSARQLAPNDMELDTWLKNLAANETIGKGRYAVVEDFKDSLQNREQTKELLQEESLVKTQDFKHSQIEKTRLDYEKNPTELQVITKYAKALADTEDEEQENKAIEVLLKAYIQTKTYRYKYMLGEIKLRQQRRKVRTLAEAFKTHPGDSQIAADYETGQKDMLATELAEYKERADNFPTDMHILYEYGKRLYLARRYDDAMATLQVAQNSPKFRADALHYLGMSFMHMGMKTEAMESLKRACDEYELAEMGDRKSKEFHYYLARAYEENDRVPEAIKIFSKVMQWDIAFKDVRARLAKLRQKATETPPAA